MESRFYKLLEVLEMLGCSRSSLERLIRRGAFPKPVKVTNRVQFFRPDVERWFRERGRA